MENSEPIDISVTLSSTFWKDPPKAKVHIDDLLLFDSAVLDKEVIDWTGSLKQGEHVLSIELYGKDKYQTIVENNEIIKDQLLNIDLIKFDEIDIGHLRHSRSSYYPDKNENAAHLLNECVNLGWNGRWEIIFTVPVYVWLLENI
jgi:hypothetical protein